MPHPSEEQLLRYSDGELPGRNTSQVHSHLKACWQCRTNVEEIEKTVRACVRYRTTGYRQIIEVHLLFPHATPVGEAHRLATALEERLPEELGMPAEVITHLESLEDHERVHSTEHYTGRPE